MRATVSAWLTPARTVLLNRLAYAVPLTGLSMVMMYYVGWLTGCGELPNLILFTAAALTLTRPGSRVALRVFGGMKPVPAATAEQLLGEPLRAAARRTGYRGALSVHVTDAGWVAACWRGQRTMLVTSGLLRARQTKRLSDAAATDLFTGVLARSRSCDRYRAALDVLLTPAMIALVPVRYAIHVLRAFPGGAAVAKYSPLLGIAGLLFCEPPAGASRPLAWLTAALAAYACFVIPAALHHDNRFTAIAQNAALAQTTAATPTLTAAQGGGGAGVTVGRC